jgi:hypothetical protein
MIRERVSTQGVLRPLEPAEELEAMKMPAEEIGMIKEGPAMRYVNGQALWNQRFSHTIKRIARHRLKHVKHARERDAGKIVALWSERARVRILEREQEEAEAEGEEPDSDGWDTDDTGHEHPPTVRGPDMFQEKTWTWRWALEGEAPPPSAIVSRRDYVSRFGIKSRRLWLEWEMEMLVLT